MTQHIYNGVGFNGFKLDSSLTARSSAASLKTTMRHLMSKLGLHATLFALLLSLVCWTQLAWSQDAPILAADYPDRYTVIDGDTLWAFLRGSCAIHGVGLRFGKATLKLKTQI